MTDPDIDALFSAVGLEAARLDPAEEVVVALERLAIPEITEATPETRGSLVRLHADLERIEKVVSARRRAIEAAFVRAAAALGADEVRTSEGLVRLRLPDAHYETHADLLRRALLELVPTGALSKDEVDQALQVVVSYKPNHTRLNTLARHRGDAVRSAIEEHRTRVEAERTVARPEFPRR